MEKNDETFKKVYEKKEINSTIHMELKRCDKFILLFPEEFNIDPYLVKNISNPRYVENKWEPIEINFIEPIGPSTSEKLLKLIPKIEELKKERVGCSIFKLKLKILDPCDFVIETWNISVKNVSCIDFGSFDYANNNRRESKMIINPLACTCKNELL